jgi:hypothetical protein
VAADARTPAPAAAHLTRMLPWERDAEGVEGVRHSRFSACHATLWLNRGLLFLQTLMELYGSEADVARSPRACAAAAYQLTLRPYHGMVLAGVVRAALSFAPADRGTMVRQFGWADEDAALADVAACAAAMRPVTRRVADLLRAEGLDFPDKIASPLGGGGGGGGGGHPPAAAQHR